MREKLGEAFGLAALLIAGVGFVISMIFGFVLYLGRVPGDEANGPRMPPLELALWPAPQDARTATSPRDVARSFVEDFVGVENPALGAARFGGVVDVFRRGADGRRTATVVARIFLEPIDRRWFVTSVVSNELEISVPGSLHLVVSPLKVVGSGRGDVVVRVHAAFDPQPLARRSVATGAARTAPFESALTFASPRRGRGVVVARAGGGRSGSQAFAVIPVRFGSG